MKKLSIILFVLCLFSASVAALELAANERKIIEKNLTLLQNGFKKGNWRTLYKVMPPKLVKPSEEWVEMFVYGMQLEAKSFVLQSVEFALDNVQLEKSATERDYLFIPMKLFWKDKQTETMKITSGYLLAFKENKRWYFLDWWESESWNEYYQPLLKQIYPDLADIKQPP